MMPFDESFRRMLVKYIPRIDDKKLDEYEGLVAHSEKLHHEIAMIPPNFLNTLFKNYVKLTEIKSRSIEEFGDELYETRQQFLTKVAHSYQTPIQAVIKKRIGIAAKIFKPYKPSYDAAHRLWVARRKFALDQGCFWQVHPSFRRLIKFISSAIGYWIVSIQTLPVLWLKKIQLHLFDKNDRD